MAYRPTDRVIVIDMDGTRLAIFGGYDAPSPTEIFSAISNATRVVVYNRREELRETHWR